METRIQAVLFDIGGTLGDLSPATNTFTAYPSSKKLLETMQKLGLRIGVITTLMQFTNEQGKQFLKDAGLFPLLDPQGFISEHDVAEKAKPDPAIYLHAAAQIGVPIEQCLFVGENLIEVIGARVAGMQSLLKPSPPDRELP